MDRDKKLIVLFGFIFVALGFMSIKLSVPALAILEPYLETTSFKLELTGSLYLLVFSFSQLFWGGVVGPLRRKRVIGRTMIFSLVGTIIAMCATDIQTFMTGRLIEAFGMGAASSICRVMLSDRLTKHEIADVSIFFGLIFNFGPFIAPLIGQYLIIYFGWRAIFAFFLILVILFNYFMMKKMPETKRGNETRLHLFEYLSQFGHVISHKRFWVFIGSFSLYVSLILGYYMAVPFWYVDHFKMNPRYYLFLVLFTTTANAIAYFFSRGVVKRRSPEWAIVCGYFFCVLGTLVTIGLAFFFRAEPWNLVLSISLIAFGTGFMQPAVNVAILDEFRGHSGIAGSFIPIFGYAPASLVFLILTNISLRTLWPFAIVLTCIALLALINVRSVLRHLRKS
ncbi:MAG: MFS transporter [Simkaniaceae bacterium]|nr:MFS transporter [Simkaniaceae bacterium]